MKAEADGGRVRQIMLEEIGYHQISRLSSDRDQGLLEVSLIGKHSLRYSRTESRFHFEDT